jgi:hypothetical protein
VKIDKQRNKERHRCQLANQNSQSTLGIFSSHKDAKTNTLANYRFIPLSKHLFLFSLLFYLGSFSLTHTATTITTTTKLNKNIIRT